MRVEVLVLSIAAGALAHAATLDDNPCQDGDGMVVATGTRRLFLCDNGQARAEFRVALGSGGLGKQRQGDRRTPLGRYALGVPRRSPSFGVFVPVGYPTAAQAQAGYTGGAIGVHGPRREFVGAGLLNTVADWAAGCIAVGSDREINEISAWVRAQPHPTIRIQ